MENMCFFLLYKILLSSFLIIIYFKRLNIFD